MEQNTGQLTEFKKYPNLANEMHHHIISYCNDPTRLNYSLCSKRCNALIQPFNEIPPEILNIKEKSDGIEVKLRYRKGRKEICNMFEDTKKIEKFIMNYYKYVGQKQTENIVVDVRKWPMNIMKMKNITNIEHWDVTISGSMYNDFMDYLKNTDLHINSLELKDCLDAIRSGRVTISSEFFKTDVFRNLRRADLSVKTEIDSEDFINLTIPTIHFSSAISFEDIRAKVKKWNSETQTKGMSMVIYYPDLRGITMDTIFPPDQFHVGRQFVDKDWEIGVRMHYYIGKVVGELEKSRYVDTLKLNFNTEPHSRR